MTTVNVSQDVGNLRKEQSPQERGTVSTVQGRDLDFGHDLPNPAQQHLVPASSCPFCWSILCSNNKTATKQAPKKFACHLKGFTAYPTRKRMIRYANDLVSVDSKPWIKHLRDGR